MISINFFSFKFYLICKFYIGSKWFTLKSLKFLHYKKYFTFIEYKIRAKILITIILITQNLLILESFDKDNYDSYKNLYLYFYAWFNARSSLGYDY